VSLTHPTRDHCWRVESSLDEWTVTASLAMPAWQYRQLLSVFVRHSWQLGQVTCRWLPELDPFAIVIETEFTDVIMCWNRFVSAVAIMVPTDLSHEDREAATKLALNLIAFMNSLIGTQLQPLAAFPVSDDDEEEVWLTSETIGSA